MGPLRAILLGSCCLVSSFASSAWSAEFDDAQSSDSEAATELASYIATDAAPIHRHSHRKQPLSQWSFLSAIEGSKQPQDYGVNANLGMRFQTNYSRAISAPSGLGMQMGTAITWTDNAVRVFEILGEATERRQYFSTVGLFQRCGAWGWGLGFDHFFQDSYDSISLGQWRGRFYHALGRRSEIGLMGRLRAFDDEAQFNSTTVLLRSIDQGSVYFRHQFDTGVQTTTWFGLIDEHGESNAVTGSSPATDERFVFGADFLAPLNDSLAIYGETNLTMPADTGTVDAFMGVVWYPFTNARTAHRERFAPMLPVAASTSFGVDLLP